MSNQTWPMARLPTLMISSGIHSVSNSWHALSSPFVSENLNNKSSEYKTSRPASAKLPLTG